MSITKLGEHQNPDTVAALRDLLDRAEHGRIRAFAFAAKTSGRKRHLFGFTGDYATDPLEALGPITRMEYKANQLASLNDDEPETSLMPL